MSGCDNKTRGIIMSTPSELDALKEQLDTLLDDRLGHIERNGEDAPDQQEEATATRPTPTPDGGTVSIDESKEAPFPENQNDIQIMRRAINQIAGPFIVYGENFGVIFANKMARTLWPNTIEGVESGLSILEATSNEIRVIAPHLSETQVVEIAKEKIAMHNNAEPNEVMTSDGRWFRLHHHTVKGEYVCAMGVDITELKRREEQLQEAREEAEQANTAKSAFLARMSHEIKTPLNAIVGMSDALMEDTEDPEILETLEYIVTAAEGVSHVLGQTLDHAKLMSEKVIVELQQDDLRDTVKKVAGMWKKPCAKKNVKLNVHIHKNIPEEVVFDRFRFQQCLNNLLSNAIKFTDSGHITVAAKMIEKSGKPKTIAIVVQDSGVGMSEDAQARIFNAYEQAEKSTTRVFGGTGLGLSITKQLVEAMNGTISVQSDEGKGTAFLMMIPGDLEVSEDPLGAIAGNLAAEPPASVETVPVSDLTPVDAPQLEATVSQEEGASEKPASPEEKTPFEGLSVLCVEDNPVNHAVIKKLIGKQVKTISFAHNGEEGLKALSAQNFDVVLMDIHMPVMDGIEATLKIRGSDKPWADVIIIAVTADPDFQYQRVCRNIGMNDAIGKPVKRQDILDSIARSLDVLKETHAQRIELPVAVSG